MVSLSYNTRSLGSEKADTERDIGATVTWTTTSACPTRYCNTVKDADATRAQSDQVSRISRIHIRKEEEIGAAAGRVGSLARHGATQRTTSKAAGGGLRGRWERGQVG